MSIHDSLGKFWEKWRKKWGSMRVLFRVIKSRMAMRRRYMARSTSKPPSCPRERERMTTT
jgi:hypothetical protein